MRKSTKRLLGGLALAAGALGAIGTVVIRKNSGSTRAQRRERAKALDAWARPGMTVVFRAELMPGRDTSERTYHVTSLLPNGRVLLDGVAGEHTQTEFQRVR
ncbi:MAG: hypothetical protein AABM67_06765 [Acidobacteriota bacterium]